MNSYALSKLHEKKMGSWLCRVVNTKHAKFVRKLSVIQAKDDAWRNRYVSIAQNISQTVRSIPQKYKSEYLKSIKNLDSEALKKFENIIDMKWAMDCPGYERHPVKFKEHMVDLFMWNFNDSNDK